MFNFIIECISLSIISLIVISLGYYIYDYYVSNNENINNKKQLDEINSEFNDINIDELESLINGNQENLPDKDNKDQNNEIVDENNEIVHEKDEKDEKDENIIEKNGKKYKIKKNNSLSSMDELDTIKSSLNKMLNDLNTKN